MIWREYNMKRRNITLLLLLVSIMIFWAILFGCAPGKQEASTPQKTQGGSALDQVLKKGELTVAVFSDAPPWGYRDDKGKIVGAEVEMAEGMAKAMKVKLNLVETTNANRIPYLLTNKVDAVIATFSITQERRQSISFSDPYFRGGAILAVNKNLAKSAAIKTYHDCAGKTIAVVKGTLNDEIATRLMGDTAKDILRFDNISDVFLALEQGKAEAIVEDFVLIAYTAKTKSPWMKTAGDAFSNDFIGIGVRRGDQDWLNWINGFVFELLTSGEMKKILAKYDLEGLPVNFTY
jgi:polar amino acid transport system substrate-binding protein